MKIGYCRVSTSGQSIDLQVDALKQEGCEKVFKDTVSGAKAKRAGLDDMLSHLRNGDIVIVYKLDRLGRSLKHLVELINLFAEMGVGLKSLSDPIDTTSPQGKLITNIFAAIAEFERDLIRERTQAGLAAARARGRQGGRPKGLTPDAENTAIAAEALYKENKLSAQQIARRLNISKTTLYKYLRYRNVPIGAYKKPTVEKAS